MKSYGTYDNFSVHFALHWESDTSHSKSETFKCEDNITLPLNYSFYYCFVCPEIHSAGWLCRGCPLKLHPIARERQVKISCGTHRGGPSVSWRTFHQITTFCQYCGTACIHTNQGKSESSKMQELFTCQLCCCAVCMHTVARKK